MSNTHSKIGKISFKNGPKITALETPKVSKRVVAVKNNGKEWGRVTIENFHVDGETVCQRDTALYILECARDSLIYDD